VKKFLRVLCDRTKETSTQIFIPYEISIILIFSQEEWLVGGRQPFVPKILGQTGPISAKTPIFNRYSLVAPQPQHLAKKVQLSLIGSPPRTLH